MTQVAAICKALLNGQTLSIMTGFQMFACTNLPRELSRSVEQKFGVVISKDRVDFKSKYGQPGYYYRYRLNASDHNKDGIQKMREYVAQQSNSGKEFIKKTSELNSIFPIASQDHRKVKQTDIFGAY